MVTRRSTLLAGLLTVAVAGGCTTSTTGAAGPTDSAEVPVSSTGRGSGGAPPIEEPVDVSGFQDDPCRALTAAQLTELGVGPAGEPAQEVTGMACRWRHPDGRGSVQVLFMDEDGNGLGSLYAAQADGRLKFFEELPPVDGYPAVAWGVSDVRADGRCAVGVGVNPEVAFSLQLRQSTANIGQADPCEVAVRVARMVLRTMRG